MHKIVSGMNLIKSFGEGDAKRNVLDGVSVEISEGEFVAVMGPSGSGKSTLLYALSGMDRADSGKVVFDSKDISTLKEHDLADMRRLKMGFVFQHPTFLKNLNILDNIILPSLRGNEKDSAKITKQARALMQKTNIEELERRSITQVSGGQLQRAGICRALMSNPRIIFGDEPTGALNSKSAQEIMHICSDINAEGTAVMLVTHDVNVALWAERVLFMHDGKIVCEVQLGKFSELEVDERIKKVTEKMQEIGV